MDTSTWKRFVARLPRGERERAAAPACALAKVGGPW